MMLKTSSEEALHEIGGWKSRLGGQMWTFNQEKNDKVSVGPFACLRNDPAIIKHCGKNVI